LLGLLLHIHHTENKKHVLSFFDLTSKYRDTQKKVVVGCWLKPKESLVHIENPKAPHETMHPQPHESHLHATATVALPLRLAAEPYAKEVISSSCVSLGIPTNGLATSAATAASAVANATVELAVLCDDDGIHAFCSSHQIERDALLEILQAAAPTADFRVTGWKTSALLALVRSAGLAVTDTEKNPTNLNHMQWYWYPQNAQQAIPVPPDQLQWYVQQHKPVHNSACAQLITNSIRHYYTQQILEPSVRGFLSVLEKQFSRADLYLFELLQNAVDDGATIVEFCYQGANKLVFRHNGRTFSPLDVLGLSSVGLSTKSRQGKRTIGFMGVGFKAVYKRYGQVTIDDGTYRFMYREPPNNQLGYGWVMLPFWKEKEPISHTPENERTGWCHFTLEEARGGAGGIKKDLRVLPHTAAPLLGRAALVKMTEKERPQQWILDWTGKRHCIERKCMTSYSANDMDGSELITVTISNSKKPDVQRHNFWLFVTHRYKPSQDALETYFKHTKRSHEGFEEVCGFVSLLADDTNPTTTTYVPHTMPYKTDEAPTGLIHSVLPTDISMPVSMHFQGSWLLSVDRQQVQDLTDNAWNGEILQQFPFLLINVFRWAAGMKLSSKEQYSGICLLLPTKLRHLNVNQRKPDCYVADILNQEVPLKALEQAFWSEPILPVGTSYRKSGEDIPHLGAAKTNNNNDTDDMSISDTEDADFAPFSYTRLAALSTRYCEGANSIWVPPSWFEYIEADFLRGWLGKIPLRTDLMTPECAYHFLFSSSRVVGQLNPLPMRTSQLALELGVRACVKLQPGIAWKVIQLMAAVGSGYDEYPSDLLTESKSSIQNTADNESRSKQKDTIKMKTKKRSNLDKINGRDSFGRIDKPSLPSIFDWPFFITEEAGLARLDEIVLPSAEFAGVPAKLLFLLHPYLMKKDYVSTSSQQRSGGRWENRRRSGPPPLKRVHRLLESLICAVDRYESDPITPEGFGNDSEAWTKIASSAKSFLDRAREVLPSNVVDVATATSNLFESYSRHEKLSEDAISDVLQLTKYAFDSLDHNLLKYVLVDIPSNGVTATKLVKAASAYIGKSLDESGPGAHLENFAGAKLSYISSHYKSIADSVIARRKAISMFTHVGVHSGMAISVSVTSSFDRDKMLLEKILSKLPFKKLPDLRKNPTKSEILLPYGLCHVMNRKKYYLVDSVLPDEWNRLASAMSPTSAVGFISLLLSVPVDDSIIVTPKSVVAAANCLAGKTDKSSEQGLAPLDTVKLSKTTAAPIRLRLYFLPPGQAGAKALDVSKSRLIEQLECIKWLPSSLPSTSHLTLLRPRETLLEADPARPEMPTVELPPALLARLKASEIARALTWGTHAPPPPVGELSELANEAKQLLSVRTVMVNREAVACVASNLYDAWNAVCRSHMRDGLSEPDKKRLRMLLELPCIPVRRVLDGGGSGNWIVTPSRCVEMPHDSKPKSMGEYEMSKHLTIVSLVASDFMCDFNHSTHNPFFHQPGISMAVAQLAGMCPLADIAPNTLISICGSFVRFCCTAEPHIPHLGSPLRDAFSLCMHWCLKRPSELPDDGQSLKVFVRHGPGVGMNALPSRWVPLKGGPVSVVLDDKNTRSALLSPEMKIQLLGVLDHSNSDNRSESTKLLANIDSKVIDALKIMRLSDKAFTEKTRARGTPIIVHGAPVKLQLVCALLKSLEVDHLKLNNIVSATKNPFLDQNYEPPLVIRHEAFSREFQYPGMIKPTIKPVYAMFGRAPKLTQKKCILVSGDPDDYTMELEELILNLVGIRPVSFSATQMKPYRAALRLLFYLENDKAFHKCIRRNFEDSPVVDDWKKLAERSELLEELQKSEKSKDRKRLRELLIRGEALFDDDPDGGDSLLHSARDMYSRLEEAESISTEEQAEEVNCRNDVAVVNDKYTIAPGKGCGLENRHAWMSRNGADASPSTGNAEATAGRNPVLGNLQKLPLTGRGRGVSNLPAWVTSPDGLTKTTGVLLDETERSESKESTREHSVSSSKEQSLATTEKAKSILCSILKDGHAEINGICSTVQPPQSLALGAPSPGTGRGRGVSNLPAWMTQPGPSSEWLTKSADAERKRSRLSPSPPPATNSTENTGEGTTPPPKKTRLLMSKVSLKLDVELPPSQEAGFMSWFQSNVAKEVDQRCGTMVLSSEKQQWIRP